MKQLISHIVVEIYTGNIKTIQFTAKRFRGITSSEKY